MYSPQCGDIFLCDSNQTGAKIVKFLMQSPTIWQQIWRYFKKTLEPVRYYHAGVILGDNYIEQQWKVQYGKRTNALLSRKIIIYRLVHITAEVQSIIQNRTEEDLGKIYDIPQLIGKTLTWLTGIPYFVRILGLLSKEEEICVTRVGDWYKGICNFGVKTPGELTTKIMDEYCQKHPETWEVVYEN